MSSIPELELIERDRSRKRSSVEDPPSSEDQDDVRETQISSKIPKPCTSAQAQVAYENFGFVDPDQVLLTLSAASTAEDVQFTAQNEEEIRDKSNAASSKNSNCDFIGITFTMLYAFFNALVALIAKVLLQGQQGSQDSAATANPPVRYSPLVLTIWRQLATLLPSIYLFVYLAKLSPVAQKHSLLAKHYLFDNVFPISITDSISSGSSSGGEGNNNRRNCTWLCVGAIFASTGTILRFYAFSYLTITAAIALNYTNLIFVTILTYFLRGEKVSIVSMASGIIIIAGTVAVTNPATSTATDMIGAGIKLADTFFASAFTISARKLIGVHYIIINLAAGLFGIGLSTILALSLSAAGTTGRTGVSHGHLIPVDFNDTCLFVLFVIGSCMTHFLLVLALKYEQIGQVTIFRTLDIGFVAGLQIVFLGVVPGTWIIIGSLIIAVGVILIGVKKTLTGIS